MFTLAGFAKTITTQNVIELVTPIADTHLSISGYNLYVPKLTKLLGYYAGGVTTIYCQLASPSLRAQANIDITPVESTDLPVAPPNPIITGEALNDLVENEPLNFYAADSSATDTISRCFVWFSDDNVATVKGKILTVKATGTVTATAEAWSSAALTMSQALPAGSYNLVGARMEDAAGIAFRFLFIGGGWRPGALCHADATGYNYPYMRYGQLGVWGSFLHDQIPSVEIYRNAAGSTFTVYLDLIKV